MANDPNRDRNLLSTTAQGSAFLAAGLLLPTYGVETKSPKMATKSGCDRFAASTAALISRSAVYGPKCRSESSAILKPSNAGESRSTQISSLWTSISLGSINPEYPAKPTAL